MPDAIVSNAKITIVIHGHRIEIATVSPVSRAINESLFLFTVSLLQSYLPNRLAFVPVRVANVTIWLHVIEGMLFAFGHC
ncbi:MAG: hypothetical protein ACOY5F_14295 [Pseudomonadota bacterium]